MIVPETAELKCAYLELLDGRRDDLAKPYVAQATVFVSHAWSDPIGNAVDVMEQHALQHPNAYFWIDIFSVNQNVANDFTQEFFTDALKSLIKTVGTVLLVLSPWQAPLLATRAWCLWELHCAINIAGVKLLVHVPASQQDSLDNELLADPAAVVAVLDRINIERAEAFLRKDKDLIQRAVKSVGGVAAVNEQLRGCLRGVYADLFKAAGKFEPHPDPASEEGVLFTKKLAATLNQVGYGLDALGMWQDALSLYQQALQLANAVMSPQHPSLAVIYNNIGAILKEQGELDAAIELFEKALGIFQAAPGSSPEYTADAYAGLGEAYAAKDDTDRAIEYLERAIALRLPLPNQKTKEMADSCNLLAEQFVKKSDYAMALEYFDNALNVCIKLHSLNHPDTAAACFNVGVCFAKQGDFENSIKFQERALNTRIATLGATHPDTAASFFNLGVTHELSGGKGKIERIYFLKAADIYTSTLGPQDPRTRAAQAKLDQ